MDRTSRVPRIAAAVAIACALALCASLLVAQPAQAKTVKNPTGIASIDKQIAKVAKKNKNNLKKCVTWVYKNVKYVPTGRSTLKKSSQLKPGSKRFKTEAKAAFSKKKGDCYTFSVAAYCFAKYLGYKTAPVVGKYTSAKSGVAQDYAWTKVKQGGKWYIYDATNWKGRGSKAIKQGSDTYKLFAAK